MIILLAAWAMAPLQAGAQGIREQIGKLSSRIGALEAGGSARRAADVEGTLPLAWTEQMRWRSIGPAGTGGRIVALTAYEADPNIYWVGTAGGGLLKTTNGGNTLRTR